MPTHPWDRMIVNMIALQVALGDLRDLVGWLVWLTAGHFVAGYRSEPQASSPSDAGEMPVLAAVTVAGMALWGAYVGWQAATLAVGVSALVVTALLLCISLVDFQVRRIPNPLVLALLAWAAVQMIWLGRPTVVAALLGLIVAAAVFLLLRFVSRGAMGMGDVKLEAAVGALVGYPAVVGAMFLGVLIGGLAALILLLASARRPQGSHRLRTLFGAGRVDGVGPGLGFVAKIGKDQDEWSIVNCQLSMSGGAPIIDNSQFTIHN